jgi:hypothetical protein
MSLQETSPSPSSSPGRSRTIEYHRPWLADYQKQALFGPERYGIIEGSTKSGKAQPLDAVLYTPSGPIQMGAVQIGDVVFTPNGNASVTAIYPQGMADIYRVVFSDGSSTECTEDHLWEVMDGRAIHGEKFKKRLSGAIKTARRKDYRPWPRVLSLKEVLEFSPLRRKRMGIRITDPVQFDAQDVPIDPYAVGVLISEGGLTGKTVKFSSDDPHVIDRILGSLCVDGYSAKFDGRCSYSITAGALAPSKKGTDKCLSHRLREIGLKGKYSHQKHIPAAYRYNSEAVRWAIVQGIMDGDGFVDNAGQPHLEQTSEALARDFIEVAESLGASCIMRVKADSYAYKDGERTKGLPVYRVLIRHRNPELFFSLPRKRDACRSRTKILSRQFASIEKIGQKYAQCIRVSAPDGLYLTDRFIVTHNTAPSLIWLAEQAMAGKAGQNFWWVAPVYSQAEIAYKRMKDGFPKGMCRHQDQDRTVTLPNDTVMWFKSGEKPDNLYGEDVYAAVIDEASRVREDSWHAVRSTLTATRGPARIIGNVKGRKNWFYNLARKAEAQEPGMAWKRVTAYDAIKAGVIEAAEVEQAKRDLPDAVFRELYLAEPSDDEGNPFGITAIRACIGPLSTKAPKAWGWDLAKSVDWTVGIGLDEDGAVCRFHRFQKPWTETMQTIVWETKQCEALVDATGVGDPIVEQLQREGGRNFEGFVFSSPSKQQLMEGLSVAIHQGKVRFPEGPIVNELETFEYVYGRVGVKYSAPEGLHDDCVMALALARSKVSHARPRMIITDAMLQRAAMPGQRH